MNNIGNILILYHLKKDTKLERFCTCPCLFLILTFKSHPVLPVGIILGYYVIFSDFSHPVDVSGDGFVPSVPKNVKKSVPKKCSHPVDASGDGCELGFLIFLLDEVAQAGEYLST